SILPASSASRSLADLIEQEWIAAPPDSTVKRRDLASDPVPATAWADAVTGTFVAEEERTEAQREARALATTFADELVGADAL
ncbi:NAD(P)H-dependent oxidoreductase, partial [Klebsiella pneumoniae]